MFQFLLMKSEIFFIGRTTSLADWIDLFYLYRDNIIEVFIKVLRMKALILLCTYFFIFLYILFFLFHTCIKISQCASIHVILCLLICDYISAF